MADSVDKSLLDRLKALRGAPANAPEKTTEATVPFDSIERKKTPTREETLADRLKKLRDGASQPTPTPAASKTAPAPASTASKTISARSAASTATPDASIDDIFKTDDTTLEELLDDDEDEGVPQPEPSDAEVKKLLDQLEADIRHNDEEDDFHDVEPTDKEVDDVIARYRDELEVEKSLLDSDDEELGEETFTEDDSVLPSVPDDIDSGAQQQPSSASLDDLQSRMASLRASSVESDLMPSVPTSKPSGKPVKRLTSRGKYTDDDVDSWCTVCLEDATLKCLGCDGDPYCARCWREMHVGSAAAFDERSHRAVQFTRDGKKEKKVALGA